MPRQEQSISTGNNSTSYIMAVCYSCFKKLNWDILFAGEGKLLAMTPKKWNSYPQQVLADTNGEQLTVSSEMNNGEAFDLGGKNKKNIRAFLQTFESLKNAITEEELQVNTAAITELQQKTLQTAEAEMKEARELDAAMNLSGSNTWITYGIIGINALIFILMAVNGAGIFDSNGLVHIKWGSNYGPLTLSGDWWRLITCAFLHFGIIHLAMNMYSLYNIGMYLEPMLGKTRYIAAYLCTGIFASLASLWWHHDDAANSAGASGAIFGMYGLFLALLTTNLIPAKARQALLQSIGIFVLYNLVYGLKAGVDNAAHVGGLVSGFVMGYIYSLSLKKEKQQQPALKWLVPALLTITVFSALLYLQQHRESASTRAAILHEFNAADYKDNDKYNAAAQEFSDAETKALAPLNDTTLTEEELKVQLEQVSLPSWKQAQSVVKRMLTYNVSPAKKQKAVLMDQYTALRIKEVQAFQNYFADHQLALLRTTREDLNSKMNALIEQMQQQ